VWEGAAGTIADKNQRLMIKDKNQGSTIKTEKENGKDRDKNRGVK
jgi:hypothetical protein